MAHLNHPNCSAGFPSNGLLPSDRASPSESPSFATPGNPPHAIIEEELEWRRLPFGVGPPLGSKIVATRWRKRRPSVEAVGEWSGTDWFILGIALHRTDVELSVEGQILRDGIAWPGMHYLTAPGARAICHFRGEADWLHLHIPKAFVAGGDVGRSPATLRSDTRLHREDGIDRLAAAMVDCKDLEPSFGRVYADCIATALAGRLMGTACRRSLAGHDARSSGLMKWRLKRAVDFVEQRLAEPLSLADIAGAAGLSRMHFAAQFRASTGLRPREYVLRRRIERAQKMLLDSTTPIVEVALDVGFQSQAHFTGVFKRFVGQPPNAWRQAQK